MGAEQSPAAAAVKDDEGLPPMAVLLDPGAAFGDRALWLATVIDEHGDKIQPEQFAQILISFRVAMNGLREALDEIGAELVSRHTTDPTNPAVIGSAQDLEMARDLLFPAAIMLSRAVRRLGGLPDMGVPVATTESPE